MDSLKERMAKITSLKGSPALYVPPAPVCIIREGTIISRPTVSPEPLPAVFPIMLHSQPSIIKPENSTVPEPAVHEYASLR
jgi:hypothetical protein